MEKLPVYKTEGIIIKSADLGELDRLITIYSLGYGKNFGAGDLGAQARIKITRLLGAFHSFEIFVSEKQGDRHYHGC